MPEIVQMRDGGRVALRPCPSWCTGDAHFPEGSVADPGDGYHHYGAAAAIPTFDRMGINDPEIIVQAFVQAWTCPLDAEPGPAGVRLALAPGGVIGEESAELTPGQARDVARVLLELADVAEGKASR